MKYVLVTGASSGIGTAIAQRFHHDGYFVYLVARDAKRLKELNDQLKNSMVVVCDLSEPQQITQLPNLLDFKTVDVLVNCAGVYFNKSIDDFTVSDWQKMFQINVFAAAHLSSLFFPYFKQKKTSSIVMISSTLGQKPTSHTGAYSASKAALENLTRTLALEGASAGIRVNCVAPGIVETPIHKFNSLSAEARAKTLVQYNLLQPLGRIGQPKDIAEAVSFLASDLSSWTTGAVLNVDGGINIL